MVHWNDKTRHLLQDHRCADIKRGFTKFTSFFINLGIGLLHVNGVLFQRVIPSITNSPLRSLYIEAPLNQNEFKNQST